MKKLLALTALSLAVTGQAAIAQDTDVGQQAYMQFCATCHGANGMGDGPLTEMMTANVTDLTTLAANNDGAFPMLEVIHVIDGRTGLRAHGGPMPVYGALFDAESAAADTYGAVLYTRGKVLSLAYYLESIQK
jgi:Cytochrome c553